MATTDSTEVLNMFGKNFEDKNLISTDTLQPTPPLKIIPTVTDETDYSGITGGITD
jgi:hypothetical protein